MAVSSKKEAPEELLARRQEEYKKYIALFVAAFDELHSTVISYVQCPTHFLGSHGDYPSMNYMTNGFPLFFEKGYYDGEAPKNYVGSIQPNSLMALFGAFKTDINLAALTELTTFLCTHEIGSRYNFSQGTDRQYTSEAKVGKLVGDAVERYIQIYGITAPLDNKRKKALIFPLIFGTVLKHFEVRLVVPITLTHIAVEHFKLSDTTYIARIPEKIQLARARMSTNGTGAVKNVVGAATHAFVSSDWSITDIDDIHEVSRSLNSASENVLDAADSFFGALRTATGISTGYAQIVWVPRKWALEYFCDLTPIYGTTLRQYPGEYDNYGWAKEPDVVDLSALQEVRRIYKAILASESETIRLATKRLNGCLTRLDAADAILDGTIGLELLLGDNENQALSYKLRLRAGALANLTSSYSYTSGEIADKVKTLYNVRSAIVHGKRRKRTKKAVEPADTSYVKERLAASELLRFVLDMLLTYPEYQDPLKIDNELLLGRAEGSGVSAE